MAMFQVPQFIDQKPKIVGALTMLQFGYIAVAGLLIFGMYYVFDFIIWIILSLPIAGLAATLSFLKINGQESHKLLSAFIKFAFGEKIYTWKQKPLETIISVGGEKNVADWRTALGFQNKIKDIATRVTVGKKISKTSEMPPEEKKEETSGKDYVTFNTGEKKLVNRIDY